MNVKPYDNLLGGIYGLLQKRMVANYNNFYWNYKELICEDLEAVFMRCFRRGPR